MSTQNTPQTIELESTIFDFDLHPSENIVVSGLISGKLYCHRYGLESHEVLWKSKPFKKSCRGIDFNHDGSHFFAISKDRSIQYIDTLTGNVISCKENTHDNPLNALLFMNERMMATGDDLGVIKVFYSLKSYKKGDGYLSTWDIRKPDVAAMSDHMEDELLSLALVKNNRKAVVGSQEGILSLWSWGDWGDYTDRIVGHPSSIDAICKLDEDTICTGSSDGIIRLVTILPNGFHGILGDHGEGMPIEQIKLAHDKQYILSTGHDQSLRFWNVAHLFEENEEKDEDDEEEKEGEQKDQNELENNDKEDTSKLQDNSLETNDNDNNKDNDSWDDDSDDSDDDKNKKKRKKKQKKQKAPQRKKSNKISSSFFAGL
ncbi:WD40-repeat-containing domain protein [Cunninghamella echinulata]|nr:WD40-repeat-containing domain protein [Cunninghamella echinulata]